MPIESAPHLNINIYIISYMTFQKSAGKRQLSKYKSSNIDVYFLYKTLESAAEFQGSLFQGDLGYIGCSADVLDIVNTKCSGRHSCEISVPNTEFEQTKPCYQELKMYLETSFRCLKGMI